MHRTVFGAVLGQEGHASGHRVHLQPGGLRSGCQAGERVVCGLLAVAVAVAAAVVMRWWCWWW